MKLSIAIFTFCAAAFFSRASGNYSVRPRFLDLNAHEYMVEDINDVLTVNKAAPSCSTEFDPYALGWIYYDGNCYLFTSKHTPFDEAESVCVARGAHMAEIYSKEESNFIKSVLNTINPKDGTDYFLNGIDATNSKEIKWKSGTPMTFKDFVNGEPSGKLYLHQDYDLKYRWNTKNPNDQDNGFICKRPQAGHCGDGDVRLEVDGTPFILWDNKWSPICGHYFWNNQAGAKLFCQKLGYQSGTISGIGSGQTYSVDTFGIGMCNNGDVWKNCSGGCNDYRLKTVCGKEWCKANETHNTRVTVKCEGGESIRTRSC